MIEQSKLNGPLYYSNVVNDKLISKQINPSDVSFGPYREIRVYKQDSGYVVEDLLSQKAYYYEKGVRQNEVDFVDHGKRYLAGVAQYDDNKTQYLIQNTPDIVSLQDTLPKEFHAPVSMTGYPYDQRFTFSDDFIDLIKDLPATYVDKYKRPLNLDMFREGFYLPINIASVTSKVSDLEFNIPFPIVVNLEHSEYAVIDLEPGFTDKDLNLIKDFDLIYQEDTPRGGKHLLVRTKDKAFKFRISKNCEVVNQSMCTFYGINGKVLDTNAEYVTFSDKNYTEVGRDKVVITKASKHVMTFVEQIKAFYKDDPYGEQLATHEYTHETDLSLADFKALVHLYRNNVKPLVDVEGSNVSPGDIPWILAEYARTVIPYREKHDSNRLGAPYLVYVATAVIKRLEN